MAGAEAATAVLAVAGSTGEALPAVVSAALVISVGEISRMAVFAALAFVVAVSVGATGMGTGAITDSLTMSSSAASVLRGGGTTGTIHTDTTATAITRTVTMDTADTPTMGTAGTVTTAATVMDTAMAADQGMSAVRGGGNSRYDV